MFPMSIVTQRMTQGRWKSKLFTSSTVWTVPADVGLIWFDGCGGGGGGGGGYDGEGGGGGGGGPPALPYTNVPFPVIPGESLILTVGASGTGGAKGQNGGGGGSSVLIGSQRTLYLAALGIGTAGTAEAGGVSGFFSNSVYREYQGGVIGGYGYPFTSQDIPVHAGSGGGGPNTNGGSVFGMIPFKLNGHPDAFGFGGEGNATGGGGGAGGHSLFSDGVAFGGAGGSSGYAATGFGGGGGGGGGNAAGGNGSPGFIRIYCFTAYDI